MKKAVRLLGVILLLMGLLTGCAQKQESSMFTADNEIYTYQKIDPKKTQIVVSRTGNIPVGQLCLAFEEQNPDVQIIYLDITGGDDQCSPLEQWILNGDLPDVVITAGDFRNEQMTQERFVSLSDDPIIRNYEAAALQRTATASNVYWLPGPSDISAMIYNKTLFDQYGWEAPATFEEFVALCDQIRQDTNGEVEPWNPNAKYSNELMISLEAMTYKEVFGGLENRSWYDALMAGETTFSANMKPFFDAVQTLIDHGILREEHFAYSATTRGNEFAAGKIAMANFGIFDADNEQFDFAFMPYPTTKGELGYLCDSYSCYVGQPKKEHTDKENDAIKRFIAFFSSADGQQAYIGNAMKISNVKGIALNQSDDLEALRPAVEAGHQFSLLEFASTTKVRRRYDIWQLLAQMAAGSISVEDCLTVLDQRALTDPEVVVQEPPQVVATASEDLTILETSFLIADLYREIAGADIGLIADNAVYRGNLMRIYKGDLTPAFIHVLKPRSFANGSTLVKATMTGRQLTDALNHPAGNSETADCVYAYSGLKCEVAPWNELGSKYLSVKLADGAALDMDKLYTVAFWAGTVADEYVTETLETYEGSWEELMTAQLKAKGTIAPAKDGRIKLVWK